jgi:hypothetical protein
MHYFNAIVPFTSASIGQFAHFQKIIFGMVEFELLRLTCSSSNAPLPLSRRIILRSAISMISHHLFQLLLVRLIILGNFFRDGWNQIFKAQWLKFQRSPSFVSTDYIDSLQQNITTSCSILFHHHSCST